MKSKRPSASLPLSRALRLALSAGLLGVTWAAAGCGEEPAGPDGGGQAVRCESDADCEDEVEDRACRQGRCTDVCGAGMTYVSAGPFTQGCDASENTAMTQSCAPSAQPAHEVTLSSPFCIGRTEVTVADFRRCVAAGRCAAPPELACAALTATWTDKAGDETHEQLPINCLLWTDAKAVCEHLGGRLPTEAEWEKAARGADERRYPWGSSPPVDCQKGVNWGGGDGCTLELWPVGSGSGAQALSASKASDMAGNLWEWTADWYSDMAYKACAGGCADPTGPDTGVVRVRRGGGFKSLKLQELRASFREYHLPDLARSDLLGVRCVRPL